MELNRIIFPAPKRSYTAFTFQKLMWIPRSRFFSLKRIVKPLGESNYADTYFESRTFKEGENIQQSSNKSSIFSSLIPLRLEQKHIPCLYIPYYEGSDKILIYFHGNAEDIGTANDFCHRLMNGLKVLTLLICIANLSKTY